jgi:hypothetical protein
MGACICNERSGPGTDNDIKTELLKRYLYMVSSSQKRVVKKYFKSAAVVLKRPKLKPELHSEEVASRAKTHQLQQVYEPVEEPFELLMEMAKGKLHFLRSPAPRLSIEQYEKNLKGLFTEEEEQSMSPVRRTITYSPVSAIQ